eukprot:403334979
MENNYQQNSNFLQKESSLKLSSTSPTNNVLNQRSKTNPLITGQSTSDTNISQATNQANNHNISNKTNNINGQSSGNTTTYLESSALERLKNIQNFVKRSWQGVQVDHSGRPGTASIVNKKRYNPISENQLEDEERFRLILKLAIKLKEIDDERQNHNQHQNSSTQQNFFNTESRADTYKQSYGQQLEFLQFKGVAMNQLLSNNIPQQGYAKSYQVESGELLYKIFRGETRLVRSVLEINGFKYTESHEWNILWANSHCKSYLYEGLNEYQKINHFPSSNEITRKDKLCLNLVKMQEKHGKHNFDFIPDTYVLPDEFGDFYAHYQKVKQNDPKHNIWIVKPANLSRGRGIYLIDDIAEVSVDDISVISRYIQNPLLINGHKFDLRIYVAVTSFDPLRIYVYKEGLARFASEQYSNKVNKDNKYQHLTNYSVNKNNENFIQNENLDNDDFGFKWSLGAFCKHLESIGIDMNLFWSRIYDVIIKSIISGENQIFNAVKKTCIHKTNCFELFGYDILIDSDLKPWLIEINLSPSLACESPLDITIKSSLISELMTLVGVKKFDRRIESQNKMKNRMKSYMNRGKSMNSRYANIFNPLKERNKYSGGVVFSLNGGSSLSSQQDNFYQQPNSSTLQMIERLAESDLDISENIELVKRLAGIKHKEILRETIAEYQRKGNFVRIFPSNGCNSYDQYFQQQSLIKKSYKVSQNQGFSSLKEEVYPPHTPLESTYQANIRSQNDMTRPVDLDQSLGQINQNTNNKVMITGDDILIEYCERLMFALKSINDGLLRIQWKQALDKFLNHQVWQSQNSRPDSALQNTKWQRLECRIVEMQERRKRLIKSNYKKEGRLSDFEQGYKNMLNKKNLIVKKFSNIQLENLLKTSTKNVAQEIVMCLIPNSIGLNQPCGILVEMDQQFNLSLKARQEERKKISTDTENSMANAETEDEDLSFINQKNRPNRGNKLSKKIIIGGQGQQDSMLIKEARSNNFFKEQIISPKSIVGVNGLLNQRPMSNSVASRGSVQPKSAQKFLRLKQPHNNRGPESILNNHKSSSKQLQRDNQSTDRVNKNTIPGLQNFTYFGQSNYLNRMINQHQLENPNAAYQNLEINNLNRIMSGNSLNNGLSTTLSQLKINKH